MKSGIYKIKNKVNSKLYIGLSINIKRRLSEHKRDLINGKHCNYHLQNAWNTYGKDAFEFDILEYCVESELSDKEKFYIDLFDAFNNGYNLTKGGEDGTSGIYNGNHNDKKYTFYNIDGRIEPNITCLEMSIKYNHPIGKSHLYSVASGNRDMCDSWAIDPSVFDNLKKGNRHIFYRLDGTITEPITKAEFARANCGSNDSAASDLVNGKISRYKDWFISIEELIKYQQELVSKTRNIINEEGVILYNINQVDFRKLTGCDSASSSLFFKGKYKTVRGYTLY